MKKISLKALGATLIASAFVMFGAAIPAHAASITTFSASSSSPLYFNTANSAPIVVSFTLPTAIAANAADTVTVGFVTGSWVGTVTDGAACGSIGSVTSSETTLGSCVLKNFGMSSKGIRILQTAGVAAGSTWTVTFAANTITMPSSGSLTINIETGGTGGVVDQVVTNVSLSTAPAGFTVTFDANGGTGTTAAQSASSATALTSNGFTRSGYTFAGWNTVAAGTGTAYANGASYAFTSSATLYAQWTADASGASTTTDTLASTGFDGQPYLLVGNLLGVLGVGVTLIGARRRQTN